MDAQVRGTSTINGEITGHIAVGRYVLGIGDPAGAWVREASRSERAHIRPRPTPVLLRPRPIRGLVDRATELAAILGALDEGLPVELSGERGIGKTALLRHVAHHSRVASFADGIVYISARHQPPADLRQVIFEAFYESDALCNPTDAEIRRGLQAKKALILLDDVHLSQHELEQVVDIAPLSAFIVATSERSLWREVRSVTVGGLPDEHAVSLLEREAERPLDFAERSTAAGLGAALEGHPLRILQAAAMTRERGISRDGWANRITPDRLLTELLTSIDEKQRRALLALTALPGVPLQVQQVSGIAEVTDIETSLLALVRRGLVVRSHSRHQLADGVGDRLRRTEDLKPWANRAITYFTAWAERFRRSPDDLLAESDVLLRAQECATETRRWGEVLRLGCILEGALVLGARWGAWAITLERSLAAAKALGDRSAEAWALHEMGTRAIGLGDQSKARALLSQALRRREQLNDETGAAASRRNLSLVLAPVSDFGRGRATWFDDASVPAMRVRKMPRVVAMALTAVLFAMLGALGYLAAAGKLSWNRMSSASFVKGQVGNATTGTDVVLPPLLATDQPRGVQSPPEEPPNTGSGSESEGITGDPALMGTARPAALSDRANILIFTARPGSIVAAGRTQLCYAVSDALQARIEPGVGEVVPTSTLTCRRVVPSRTTTYQLTAFGRDGHYSTQKLVIVVQ